VVHFNFGLHDIARVNDGEPRATPEEYETNLRRITRRLKATGARLIFALTTPVPADLKSGPPRREADVLVYNEVARRVMQEEGVPLDDLHAVALSHLSAWQRPANVHYTPAGYAALAEPVAACIRARLPSAVSPK
jgi:acyl-CoA thioesterase-1